MIAFAGLQGDASMPAVCAQAQVGRMNNEGVADNTKGSWAERVRLPMTPEEEVSLAVQLNSRESRHACETQSSERARQARCAGERPV